MTDLLTTEDVLRAGLTIGDTVTCHLGHKTIRGRITLVLPSGIAVREPNARCDTPCVMPPWTVSAPSDPPSRPRDTPDPAPPHTGPDAPQEATP